MRMKIKDLKGKGVPVIFGPVSDPERFKINLLEVTRKIFPLKDINELELEVGDRLEERPYSNTGRATMPPNYLCEGSVWVNFYSIDGGYANVSLVPHIDRTGHGHRIPPHHNLWLYWTDFNGNAGSNKAILGHVIPTDEPVAITIICGEEVHKGTIDAQTKFKERRKG